MHWIALQPQPDTAPGSPPGPVPADTLTALGWWALQFTPKVAQLDGAVVLELSACERLWGGRERLVRHIFESNKPVALANQAQGATALIAIARLQSPQLAQARPDDLPLAALAPARPHLSTLEKLGCTRWGQLRALPRAGVARRFGAPLLLALDQAYGQQPELYPWQVLPETFEATLELGFQTECAPALLLGARRLLSALRLWLQLRQCGVLALALRWSLDTRRSATSQGELIVRSAEPTTDMAHLQRLLAEHLAHVTLPAPVQYLRLCSLQTQPLHGQSASLLQDEQPRGDSLPQLLERLGARLGPQQVLQWQACADHRPEHMQAWHSALDASQNIAHNPINTCANPQANCHNQALYPTWLLARPLRLAVRQGHPLYQGPLTLLAGPQRIEAGWWGGGTCALRDYFLARSAQAGLLWVFRERLAGPGGSATELAWFLHGLFA